MPRQLFKRWTYQIFAPGAVLRSKYEAFKSLLANDRQALEIMSLLEEVHYDGRLKDWSGMTALLERLSFQVETLVADLMRLAPARYVELPDYLKKILFYIRMESILPEQSIEPPYVLTLEQAAARLGLAGGKANKLGQLAGLGDWLLPRGFVVATSADNYFIEYNGFREEIDGLLAYLEPENPASLTEVSEQLQALILGAETPPAVAEEMEAALGRLRAESSGELLLAVRSSAAHEDSQTSFAGQYESVLDVRPEDMIDAWRRVLASKYEAKALSYRVRQGFADQEMPMAALILEMIAPEVSGVLYSRDPGRQEAGISAVYAVSGPGSRLVDGGAIPEEHHLAMDPTLRVLARKPGERRDGDKDFFLDEAEVLRLAQWGADLERHYGEAMDIEWCRDSRRRLFLLQARPLSAGETQAEGADEVQRPANNEASLALLERALIKGATGASPGRARGPLHRLESFDRLEAIPHGVVLVVESLSPRLASILDRPRAVLARTGSRAGHFASVAREFRLPALILGEAWDSLPAEGVVSLDAGLGLVLEGEVEGFESSERPRGPRPDSPQARRMERIMPLVAKLSLTDPQARNFTPSSVKSLHDVIRFCHEKGVAEMFSLVDKGGRGLRRAKKVESELPMSLFVLDLDGGLDPAAADQKTVRPEQFRCRPLRRVWEGLTFRQGVWDPRLKHLDWEEFDRISAGVVSLESRGLGSYAVISEDYCHLMIRFGYHFSVLDCLVGDEAESNYAQFRFKGGGADPGKRELRLLLLRDILSRHGFEVAITADMFDASLTRQPAEVMDRALLLLGWLLERTRLLDMAMENEEQAAAMAAQFLDEAPTATEQPQPEQSR